MSPRASRRRELRSMRPRATHRKPPLRTSLRLPPAVRSTRNHPALFDLTQSGPWSGAIEWRGSTQTCRCRSWPWTPQLGRLQTSSSRPGTAEVRPKVRVDRGPNRTFQLREVGNRIQPFDLVSYLGVSAGSHLCRFCDRGLPRWRGVDSFPWNWSGGCLSRPSKRRSRGESRSAR